MSFFPVHQLRQQVGKYCFRAWYLYGSVSLGTFKENVFGASGLTSTLTKEPCFPVDQMWVLTLSRSPQNQPQAGRGAESMETVLPPQYLFFSPWPSMAQGSFFSTPHPHPSSLFLNFIFELVGLNGSDWTEQWSGAWALGSQLLRFQSGVCLLCLLVSEKKQYHFAIVFKCVLGGGGEGRQGRGSREGI